MKFLLCNLLIAGILMSHSNKVIAQDSRLTPAYLSAIIDKARARYNIPAIAIVVMNSNKILLQQVQGVRVMDKPHKATLDDYFHIGSCSKSVLAVMAAKLIEQKKITWQTKFFEIFPELKENANNAYSNITLEDLFLCQAGIKAYTNAEKEPFPEYGPSVSNKRLKFIIELIGLPASAKKKNGRFLHLYSNASYTMASAMLEKVSGEQYETLVKKTLTEGFGVSVHIGWPNSIRPEQPWGHLISKKKTQCFPPDHEYKLPCLITAAGDLSMTVRDYAKYTQYHLQGLMGRNHYISSQSYRYIHFAHKGFSLGVSNGIMLGNQYSGFDGSAGTFFSRSIIAPELDFAFVIMMNAGSDVGTMKAVEWLTMRIVKKYFNWWWMFWL
jgi:CubicO group peptidase (beta-lactamase class C family)